MCNYRWYVRAAGMSGAVRGGICWLQGELQDWYCFERQTVLLLQTYWKYQTFRVACSEWVRCADSFRMSSSKLSFATKACACASVTFLAGIMCLATDYSWFLLNHWLMCELYSGCNIVTQINSLCVAHHALYLRWWGLWLVLRRKSVRVSQEALNIVTECFMTTHSAYM